MCVFHRRTAALALLLALVAPAAADEPADAQSSPSNVSTAVSPAPASFEELTERVRKSVALILSDGRDGRREGLGSGFVVSPEGLIVTNFHVIGQGRGVRVQLADGRQFDCAAIHASDRQLDLAVLRIEAKDLAALELGDSDELKQGQAVRRLGQSRAGWPTASWPAWSPACAKWTAAP